MMAFADPLISSALELSEAEWPRFAPHLTNKANAPRPGSATLPLSRELQFATQLFFSKYRRLPAKINCFTALNRCEREMVRKERFHGPSDPGMPPRDRERILGLAVNTLGRNIIWSLAQRTARHCVLPGQYPVIAWLMQLPYSTQANLARIVGIEQPTMAITLRRMERDGMIVRRPDPAHARRSFISLTPRGKELSQIMRRAALGVEYIAYAGLTRKEIKEFFRLAGVMTRNLTAERRNNAPRAGYDPRETTKASAG